jgi:hypothetical protein
VRFISLRTTLVPNNFRPDEHWASHARDERRYSCGMSINVVIF